MKKLFFVSLIALSFSAKSQTFSFGLKGGANVANFTGTPFSQLKNKSIVSFYGGAYMDFWFGKNFALQPEALISSQGAKFEDATSSENFKLTYLNVPVMLKYKTDGGFYVEAGPQVGFKLSETKDQTVGDFAKNLDLSVGAGLGYQTASGFGIGARYLAGLTKVGDFDGSTIQDPDFKNKVIQIGISYTFGSPKK